MNTLGETPLQSRSDSQAPTSVATAEPGGLTVTAATLEDWHQVTEWSNREGWNIGSSDGACFHPTDPAGFFIGRIDTRPVSALSVVNYSEQYAFMGHYLVDPDLRGQGLGLATWQAAFPHAGARTIGGDAIPARVANYRLSGFTPIHDTIQYGGRLERSGTEAAGAVRVTPEHLDAVAAYDRECSPLTGAPL